MTAFLNEVIADEPKEVPLRINGSFFFDRAVLKPEDQPRGDSLSIGDLNEITSSDRSTLKRVDRQKSMDCPLPVTHRDGLGR
jgi:hypothetical protein